MRATVVRVPGRQSVASSATRTPTRYERGIRRPNAVRLAALQGVLEAQPGISKTELARRIGVSRATISYYLRALDYELQAAKERDEALRHRAAVHQIDIAASVGDLAQRLRNAAVSLLDDRGADLAAKSVAARLSTAFERLARLSTDLAGRTKTGTTNIHIDELRAVLLGPVDVARLSPAARATIEATTDSDAPR